MVSHIRRKPSVSPHFTLLVAPVQKGIGCPNWENNEKWPPKRKRPKERKASNLCLLKIKFESVTWHQGYGISAIYLGSKEITGM